MKPTASFRLAAPADLAACARVWRAGLADYLGRLGLDEALPFDLGPVQRLFGHLLVTDPERFWVAVVDGSGPDDPAPGAGALDGERVLGFASANVRGRAWFLAMLFVDPAVQAHGLGRALLERVMAGTDGQLLGTATDSAQPVSNAMYARLGIVPRVPVLHLVGSVERPSAMAALPAGLAAPRLDALEEDRTAEAIAAIDRELLGYDHPRDHDYVRDDGKIGFAFRADDGRIVGYGYASPVGRVGPVAALDPDHLPAFVSHLVTTVPATGAHSVWVAGDAATTVAMLLRAGFRLEPFPALIAFSEPYADLSRYVPISLALL